MAQKTRKEIATAAGSVKSARKTAQALKNLVEARKKKAEIFRLGQATLATIMQLGKAEMAKQKEAV